MYTCKMKAYEGGEPYIFISYAHRDSDTVLPILDALTERGFRVWYDDGIAPGSEWPENIATHLSASSVVVAFVSPNSIASPNCRREVTFALSKNKPFLGVVLEPTEMSAGMEMQLSAQQCILRHSYLDPLSGEPDDARFMEKLFGAELLQPCRGMTCGDLDEAIAREKAEAAEAAARLEALKKAEAEKLAVQRETEALAARQKESAKKPGKEKKTRGGKQKKWPFIAAAVVLAAVAGLFLLLNGGGKVQITESKSADKDTTYLELKNETVTTETLRKLDKLKKLRSVTFTACTFDNCDPGSLRSVANWSTLTMTDCSGIPDYSFVASSTELRTLVLTNCGVSDSGLDMTGMKLEKVNLSGNPGVTNLAFLPETVRTLDVSYTGVTELSGVSGMPKLTELNIDGCRGVDLTDAAGCDLTLLSAKECGIQEIRGSIGNLALRELYLDGNNLTDASCLDGLTRLVKLSLKGNPVTGADCIGKSAGTLTYLDLSGTKLDAEFVNEQVSRCSGVKTLDISGIPVENLDCTKAMTALQRIGADGCGLTDIRGMSGKKDLQYMQLSGNHITDSSPLADLDGTAHDLYIDLHDNALSEYRLPQKLYVLFLYGNDPDILSTVPAETKIKHLAADYTPWLNAGETSNCFRDRSLIANTYILDVPDDQALNTRELLGKDYTTLVSSERFSQEYAERGDFTEIRNWQFD